MKDLRQQQSKSAPSSDKLTLRDVRIWIKASKNLSPATEKRYASVCNSLAKGELKVTKSKSTWYLQRAALRQRSVAQMRSAMGDGALAIIEAGGQPIVAHMKYIERHFSALEAYDRTRPEVFLKRRSKARQLKKLPPDWIDKLLVHGKKVALAKAIPEARFAVSTDANAIRALAIQSATGCRPAEIGRGALVQTLKSGEIIIVVSGVKNRSAAPLPADFGTLTPSDQARFMHSKGRGKRVYRLEPGAAGCTPEVVKTLKKLAARGQAMLVKLDPNTYREWMRRRTHQIGMRASPYAVRHAYASDLKGSIPDKHELIADSLGHAGMQSQNAYGRPSHGNLAPGKASNLISAEGKVRGVYKRQPALRKPVNAPAVRISRNRHK